MEKFKQKIEDDRLNPTLERVRSGTTQKFYPPLSSGRDKDILFTLPAPSSEMYAELIDGVWCWVKGCSKCEDSMNYGASHSYQVCYEHNRCVQCNTHRLDLTEIPWGHKDGFICKPCADKNDMETRRKAFEKVNSEDYDEDNYLYQDSVICPHCGSDNGPEEVDYTETQLEQECYICTGRYILTLNYSVDYSTKVIGERLTK
ncbi:MAG: hypothetical protein RBT59_11715 [Arcobacteraceae bacterium]|jgi:hypothetical protein|nr:hypothetical protein [Arcobacteraceae bacterium]